MASFSLLQRIRSFGFALAGLRFVLRTQHNAWVHLLATVVVCGVAIFLRVNANDWRWLILAIALVWFAEILNTAFEFLCDAVVPEFSASVAKAKDIAAAAVLITAVAASLIGASVFWPYLAKL
jgi:diacylglycerol kinase (ATP)